MLGEMIDTTPEARRFYFQKLAELSPGERLALMARSSRMVRQLAEAGLRRDHPDATPAELKIRLAVRLYGRELVEKFLGPVPTDAR